MSANRNLALRLSAYMSGEANKDHVAALMLHSIGGFLVGAIVFAILFAQDANIGWCGILGAGVAAFVFIVAFVRHLIRAAIS